LATIIAAPLCSFVRPSVCPIDRQQQRRPAGLLLSALRTGGIDRLLQGRRLAVSSGRECGQCYVVSRRKKLNGDLLKCTMAHNTEPGSNTD